MVKEVKQIEIKNRTHYFYNDIINLENFDSNLLKIDKKHYKGININIINIHSVNPLYLPVNHANKYIECNSVEKKNGNKYLIFDYSVNENKAVLKKYHEVWGEIKDKIKAINGAIEENDYGKDYMKIRFNSDDGLPLNKPLKFHAMTIIIRSDLKKMVNFIHKFF